MRQAVPRNAERTELVELYSYSDAGSGGIVSSTYTLVAAVWASFTPGATSERNVAEVAQHEAQATFGFHERTSVTVDMVIVINSAAYRVTGIDPRGYVPGMLRQVTALWVDKATLNLVTP
jgi:hypothetical protein